MPIARSGYCAESASEGRPDYPGREDQAFERRADQGVTAVVGSGNTEAANGDGLYGFDIY